MYSQFLETVFCAVLQVYNLLEDHMKQPKFLQQLEEAKEGAHQPETRPHGNEVFREDWWEAPKGAAGPEAESDEGYLEVQAQTGAAIILNSALYTLSCLKASACELGICVILLAQHRRCASMRDGLCLLLPVGFDPQQGQTHVIAGWYVSKWL